jgi:predicted molibdopterin-dependent oxidoreductase YjgC
LCGNGCDITASTKDGRVQKINSAAAAGSAEKYICAYGRFGFDCIEAETRLVSPMKRIDGELRETTWSDALGVVGDRLRNAGRDVGMISVAGITNEDALTLKRFAQNVVKTKNFDTTMSLYAYGDSFKKSDRADIDRADLIIVVDLNPSQWERVLPALDASVRKRVSRGARLFVINSSDTKIGEAATLNLKGDEISLLKGIAKALITKGLKADKKLESSVKDVEITEEMEKAATLIAEANDPLIFASPSLFESSANIALMKGKVISVGLESNTRGIALMGLTTEGKTYKEMVGTAESKEHSAKSAVKVLYAVGEVPLQSRPVGIDFLIVQNSHLTELAKQADIVLPAATFLESSGTMIDYMGRMKYLQKVIEPQGESKGHSDIFIDLSKVMGAALKGPTEAEVKKASKAKTKGAFSPFVKKDEFDVSPEELIESINSSVINGSRLLWLKESAKSVIA